MNINEEKRHQWQALKGMGFKAHWEYFWDYYKIHVAVGVFAIVMLGMLIHDIAANKPYALDSIFVNANSLMGADALQQGFAEYEGIDTNETAVFIDTNTSLSPDGGSMDISMMEKIYAMIAAKELDTFLADTQIFEKYANNEMFLDLREVFTEEELSELGDKVYYLDYAEIERQNELRQKQMESGELYADDGTSDAPYEFVRQDPSTMENPVPYGIILENNELLKQNECYTEQTPIAGISASSERKEVSADFIRYLLGK